jgi:hypothetical protein
MVEFAIIMPLLFLLLFGIISFGLLFDSQLSITDGAREAGRYGATLPVTNYGSDTAAMHAWLDDIADRAVMDASGQLDPGVENRSICVAYVHPNGTADIDLSTMRVEAGGATIYSNQDGLWDGPCFDDGRPVDERRVQVLVGRDADIEAIFFSTTVTLESDSVTRFEATFGPS